MLKKIHFLIEYSFSFLKRNIVFLLFGIVTGFLIFTFQGKIISIPQLPIFNAKIIGIEGRYTQDKLPQSITQLITYGLTIHQENDKPILSPIVESLNIENDNLDYIFRLKNDLHWHDGKKLTSDAINYQIPGLDIQKINKYEIKISTKDPFAPILSLLDQPLFRKNLSGLGEHQITKVNYQYGYIKNLTLKPKDENENNIIYQFYPNQNDLITAFKLGEVDQIQISILPKEFSEQKNIKITQTVQVNNQYAAVFLNTKKFTNKQFRQSLAYATPKDTDSAQRCLGPISPHSWAYNPSVKQYNFDPKRARELFNDSQEKITQINLTVNNRKLLPIAEKIKKSWSENLGIKVNVTIENQIDQENFDAVIAFGGIPHDPDQYYFWHSTQTNTNLTNFTDERIDKLLEVGRQTLDQQERKKIYLDFQKYLLEESPAIFLSYPTLYTINRVK